MPSFHWVSDTAVDTGSYSDDQEEFEKLHLEIRKEEIRKFLTSGSVSKNLYDRLEVFTAKPVTPEHVWNPTCKQCSKCNVCMEQGGQRSVQRCQTEGFKGHLCRIPHEHGHYHYEVEYLQLTV
jgi:hypothetical protein